MNHNSRLHLLPAAIAITLLATACASIGRPDGGPRDETPPRFIASSPTPGSINFNGNRITLTFDENVQLDNPSEKVVVSPPQIQMPSVMANGRHVTVTLKDSLVPEMTYTIDFSDGVKDLNEGNVLEGLAVDFSTGAEIDTLRISGMVFEARNLEPAQGMFVGVYTVTDSLDADTAITSRPFERIARTNQYGQFTIRNLKPGEYRVYALNDLNRDYHWDRSEDVAFLDFTVSPTASMMMVTDTLVGEYDADSLVSHAATRYLPDDLLLTWFNEGYQAQYLKEYKRPERNKIHIETAAPSDSLPRLTIVGLGSKSTRIPLDSVALLQRNERADSMTWWLRDTSLILTDSIYIETTYRRVDSLDNIVWGTDTLKFFNKRLRGKKAEEEAAKLRVRTLQQKIDSVHAISDTLAIDTFKLSQPDSWLDFRSVTSGMQELHKPLYFEASEPVSFIDSAAVRLEFMPDSVWLPVKGLFTGLLPADTLSATRFMVDYKWVPETKYRLTVDSMAIHGIYPVYNKPVALEFTTKSLEDYSTIIFSISGVDTIPAIVELLGGSDTPVATSTVGPDGKCVFTYIAPGTYYARLFFDADHNGEYTTGNLKKALQPEETYYFPKKLTLKKNWDLEQSWNINELAIDLQKPLDIKKNKPKEKPGDRNRDNNINEDEEDDGFDTGSPFSNTGFGSTSQRGFRTNGRY